MSRSLRRRKWTRRGAACAEFLLAIVAFYIESLLQTLWMFWSSFSSFIAASKRPQLKSVRDESFLLGKQDIQRGEERFAPRAPRDIPMVNFASVAGLDDVKREVMLRTVLPLQHPAEAATYNVSTGGGVLLWGPPGCGKTLLARAIAGELQCSFFHVRPSELMDQWVGQSEKNIATLFHRARNCNRAVVFMDEIDALCPSRRRNHSTIMQRVISEVLSQMDGLDTTCSRTATHGFLLVVGTTNWIEALDEAVLRPGRFDVRVFVGLPNASARWQIFQQALSGRPVSNLVDIGGLVERTHKFSGADVVNLINIASRNAFLSSLRAADERRPISPEDFDDAFATVRPSISDSELRRYYDAAQARGEYRVMAVES